MKYSPSGGDVLVEISRDDGWAVVSVMDHGLGIPAADLPHIFERFRRARNVGRLIAGSARASRAPVRFSNNTAVRSACKARKVVAAGSLSACL